MAINTGNARAHVLRRGKIVFRRGYGVIDCVVLDLSPEGARLRVGSWLGLPESFELRIENGPVREARVRYRGPRRSGCSSSKGAPPEAASGGERTGRGEDAADGEGDAVGQAGRCRPARRAAA